MNTKNKNIKSLSNKLNKEQYNKLLFALEKRTKPTIVLASCTNKNLRDAICAKLKKDLPEYWHLDINTGNTQVESLYVYLRENLPKELFKSEKVNAIAHVFDLENSLYDFKDGRLKFSPLLQNLNFQRELLFRNLPVISIIWTDEHFFKILRSTAQDLSDWITYVFEFKGDKKQITFRPIEDRASLIKPGKTPERNKRIKELEEDLSELPEANDNYRIKKERILLEGLLGEEYLKQRDFTNAEKHLKKTLYHSKEIDDEKEITHALFWLGKTYMEMKEWDKALENFNAILYLENPFAAYNIGVVYHNTGIIYEAQNNWDKALENLNLAIDWHRKTNQKEQIGASYFQIGNVYFQQDKVNQALENYHLSFKWNRKTNQEQIFGAIYHQIGNVYASEGKWKQALENFKKAVEWDLKTGNEHELGSTYHQIAMVFENLKDYDKALEYYLKSKEIFESQNIETNIKAVNKSIAKVEKLISTPKDH